MRTVRTTRAIAVGGAVAALLAGAACSSGGSTTASGGGSSSTASTAGGSSGTGGSGGSTTTTKAGGGAGSTTTAASGSTSGSSGPLARYAGFESATYAEDENWVCRAGRADDLCETLDLDLTVIKADGTTEVKKTKRATDPAYDCFYVYPTVNLATSEPIDNAMAADPAAEVNVTKNQFARFSEQCRTYAPLYRQVTFAGFGAANAEELFATAYGDVADSFKYYMAHWNEGRPFVLVGHSQGSGMLLQLLQKEFDGAANAEVRAKLISALLGGGRTEVPAGKDAGASFQDLPLCRAETDVACVVGFNTVAGSTSPDLPRWGSAEAGNERACNNPAAPARGSAPTPILPIVANQGDFAPGVSVTTPWVAEEGVIQAQCVTADDLTTLQVTAVGAAGDVRDSARFLQESPGWGLHITEMGLVQGDLLALAAAQAAAWPG